MQTTLIPAAASAAIVAIAAAAQAATGFGFSMLAIPVLAVLLDAPTAVVGTTVVALFLTTATLLRDRGHVRWRVLTPLILAAAVGMPAGVLILHLAPPRVLLVVIAGVVLGCTAVVAWPPGLAGDNPRLLVAGAGLLTGVLTTSTGTNGPPLVATLRALDLPPRATRATLAAVFFLANVGAVTAFVAAGELTPAVTSLALVGTPAALLGWLAGDRLFARLSSAGFRRVVLMALACGALLAVGTAVAG